MTLVSPAPAQTRVARLDSVLHALHNNGLFSGAVAIAENGEVVYRQAHGDLGGAPITLRTPMRVASVSKMLTATVVLSLAAEGRVDLDAPVGRYVIPWPYPDITVRHLLNQTSGLHFLTTLNAHADTTATITRERVLDLIATHTPGVAFAPGTAFDYDEANYIALAAVIEGVTGETYPRVVQERVLLTAGMRHAQYPHEQDWLMWGGAHLEASAEDLLAYDHAFAEGRLVPQTWVAAAQTPPTLADGTRSRYGFGRFLTDDPRPLVGHFGEAPEAKTGLWRERDTGTAYAILLPGDGILRTAILTAIMAIWNGEPFALPAARPVADVPETVLARYVGVYDSGMGRLHITLAGGGLHLEPEGSGGSEPLIPASETVFYFGHQDLTWEFVLGEDGAVTGLMLQNHPETLGRKVE